MPIKKENVSDGEGDLKDGAESAGESYNDPNDDDYVPDSEHTLHCYYMIVFIEMFEGWVGIKPGFIPRLHAFFVK